MTLRDEIRQIIWEKVSTHVGYYPVNAQKSDDIAAEILDLIEKELPEIKAILSAEDFNHLEEFQYALMQERNIGFNQAVEILITKLREGR